MIDLWLIFLLGFTIPVCTLLCYGWRESKRMERERRKYTYESIYGRKRK